MHSQIRIQITNRQCQCWMCQTGTALSPLDADMDRNTAAVVALWLMLLSCALCMCMCTCWQFRLSLHRAVSAVPADWRNLGHMTGWWAHPETHRYSLLAFRWTRSKSRFPVFRKHCIQPLIAFVLISGFERRIVESWFCFHIVNARISQYSYSGVVHLKAPVQTSYWITWECHQFARSMLAELAYIVLLVENWFLAWFTWKQAGITFRSRMLACICCCLCRDSICIQLLCLERQTSSVSYAVPVCMQWNHLISYNPMSWFCAVLENTSMYNMSNCHNLT